MKKIDNRKNMQFIDDRQIKGVVAENLAKNYFLSKGYLVFSSSTAQGCIDLVVIKKNGKVLKIDVKAVSRRKRDNGKINRRSTNLQKIINVKLFYVDVDKKECYFYKNNDDHLKRRTKVEKII